MAMRHEAMAVDPNAGLFDAMTLTDRDVLAMVLRRGILLTVAGLLAVALAALAVGRLIAALLVDVSATDPLIFSAAAFFLAFVALLASYLPAMRASKIDLMIALRRP